MRFFLVDETDVGSLFIMEKGCMMSKSKIYLVLQTVLCILLVALLCASAVSIYLEGSERKAANPLEWIYTRDEAAKRFAPIAPLFFASIGLMLAGLILEIRDENQDKPVKDAEISRDLLVARVSEPSDAMKKEQALQKKYLLGGWAAFGVCMIPILLYITNGNHFPDGNLEPMFYSLLTVFLPWTAVGLGCLMVTSVLREKSMVRETEAAKEQMKTAKAAGNQEKSKTVDKTDQKPRKILCAVLLVVAVLLIVAGVFNGSADDVHHKAVNICTECVGLG